MFKILHLLAFLIALILGGLTDSGAAFSLIWIWLGGSLLFGQAVGALVRQGGCPAILGIVVGLLIGDWLSGGGD